MSNDAIHAGNAPVAVGRYPHARRVGAMLFLSGIGPRDAKDNSIPGKTPAPSTFTSDATDGRM